jgi:hypothetical protein
MASYKALEGFSLRTLVAIFSTVYSATLRSANINGNKGMKTKINTRNTKFENKVFSRSYGLLYASLLLRRTAVLHR